MFDCRNNGSILPPQSLIKIYLRLHPIRIHLLLFITNTYKNSLQTYAQVKTQPNCHSRHIKKQMPGPREAPYLLLLK